MANNAMMQEPPSSVAGRLLLDDEEKGEILMTDRESRRYWFFDRPVTRRRVLGMSGALAAAAAIGPAGLVGAQGSPAAGGANLPAWEPRYKDKVTLSRFGFGTDNITSKVRVDAFKKVYPNITLQVTPEVTDQKILTAVASGSVPDLFWLDTSTIQSWASRGALESLDDLIKNDDRFDLKQFYDAQVKLVQYKGETYGIPQFVDCRPLWLDQPALQDAGLTVDSIDPSNWQQLQTDGTKLLKKNGGKIQRWGFDPKTDGFFWMWVWGNGSDLLSKDGQTATFDDPKNVEALQFNVDTFKSQGGYEAYQAFIQTTGFEGKQNFFVQNQVGMTLFENWLLGIVAEGDPNHQFTVTPFKGKDGKVYSLTGGNTWAIPKGAKHKDAAWEWISYFSSPTIWVQTSQTIKQQLVAQKSIYTPSLTASETVNNLLRSQVFTGTGHPSFDNAVKVFPQLLSANEQAAASPVLKQINDILSNTVVKPALGGSKSAADALKEGQSKAQKALDDFFKK